MSRALVMYDSLLQTRANFHLYIFAFDDLAYTSLLSLNLQRVTVISLREFENEKLLAVKPTRTKAEYCWTSTSSTIRYVFDRFDVDVCTYIDADLFFYSSPEVLINELPENKDVLISEHRYTGLARFFEQRRAGRFCVQFVTFRNTGKAKNILDKWIDQCIDWCYARYEDNKFGDQKYLDSWPEEYDNVAISGHIGGGVAPWNNRRFGLEIADDRILISEGESESDLVYFHFHYVKLLNENEADLGWNRLKPSIIDKLYRPYLKKILGKEAFLEKSLEGYVRKYTSFTDPGTKGRIKSLIKKYLRFNIIKIAQ